MFSIPAFLICLMVTFHIEKIAAYNLTVKTESGYVQGSVETSTVNEDVTYFAFKGVPYGEPPIGVLRFQDPIPVSSWEGIKETTGFGPLCACYQSGAEGVYGEEDCLYLNVYVPYTEKDNEDISLPVMVSIHGGGFTRGHARSDPSYFMEKPVIIVTINYRLGVLGFLSTLDENARGNAGLKDQVLALEWVQKNIEYFGGDAKRVTIFGQSAGGASVEYLLISPKSNGLFSQALSESGSTLNEWGFRKDPLTLTLKLARYFNVTSDSNDQIVSGLQEIDFVTLIMHSVQNGTFVPSIESESEEAFVSRSTYDIWTDGDFIKVPFLVGYTSEDGSYGKSRASQYVQDPKKVIPAGLNIDENSEEAEEVVELITKRYFPDYSYDNFTNSINFMTQHYFVRGIRKTIAEFVKTSVPVYVYKFTYVTKANYTRGANGGAGHAEEWVYMWHTDDLIYEEDVIMKDRMITLWTNFAIYGNPTPKEDEILENVIWKEATEDVDSEDSINYLELGYSLQPGVNPDQEDFLFWRELFEKYSHGTVFTY